MDIGSIDSQGWTIDIANDEFWKNRGTYSGATPEGRFAHSPHVPAQSVLPFGTSYETFRNPGKTFRLDFSGPESASIIEGNTEKFWFGGSESQADHILNVDSPVAGGQTVTFNTWYFIEEDYDYGYVEALVNGTWVTVPSARVDRSSPPAPTRTATTPRATASPAPLVVSTSLTIRR